MMEKNRGVFMLERIKQFDFILISAIVTLSIFGLIMVYTSSYTLGELDYNDGLHFFKRQLIFFIAGLVLMFISSFVSLKFAGRISPWLILISVVLLILVLTPQLGVVRNGSRRWVNLGVVFQPSEIVKIFMVIYFAKFYSQRKEYFDKFFYGVMPPLILFAIVAGFIMAQPDLGTTIHLLAICGAIIIFSGVKFRHIIGLILTGAGLATLFAIAEPYRLQRITSFMKPFEDLQGAGYQLASSYVSIATGGLFGAGLGNSVQKLGYLPEAHTDFIMSVIVEELGVIGITIVVGCYLIILFRGIKIANEAHNDYYRLLGIGITFQIIIQAIINLGAMSGLMPITGIPLPFISYGGTSLVIMMVASGLLINVSGRKKTVS
ncbi:putative lipid II flippase FtsW [Halolactibacillus sp. JCM 19043]